LRVAIDTNVLAYAEGVNDRERRDAATAVLRGLVREDVVIPVQVLGELFTVLMRKGGRTPGAARDALAVWRTDYTTVDSTSSGLVLAADLAADHGLFIWDAVILAAASSARCSLLLSEDMHDGFTWGGVTVTNPFGGTVHPLLRGVLDNG
jgi:predicted nucleic acid-binding protein